MTRYSAGEVELSRVTDEQIRIAELLADSSVDPALQEKLNRIREVTGNRNTELVFSVLHDCEYNVNAAIEALLDQGANKAAGEWQSTTKKPKKKGRDQYFSGPRRTGGKQSKDFANGKDNRYKGPKSDKKDFAKGKPHGMKPSMEDKQATDKVDSDKWEAGAAPRVEWGPAKTGQDMKAKPASAAVKGGRPAPASAPQSQAPVQTGDVKTAKPSTENRRPIINSKVIENPNKPAIAWSQITKQKPPQPEAPKAPKEEKKAPVKPVMNKKPVTEVEPKSAEVNQTVGSNTQKSNKPSGRMPANAGVPSAPSSQPKAAPAQISQGAKEPVQLPDSSKLSGLEVQFGSLGVGFGGSQNEGNVVSKRPQQEKRNSVNKDGTSQTTSSTSTGQMFNENIQKDQVMSPQQPAQAAQQSATQNTQQQTKTHTPISMYNNDPKASVASNPGVNPALNSQMAYTNPLHYQMAGNAFNMNPIMGNMPSYSPYDGSDMQRGVAMQYFDQPFQPQQQQQQQQQQQSHQASSGIGASRSEGNQASSTSRASEAKYGNNDVHTGTNAHHNQQPQQQHFPSSAGFPYGYNPYTPYPYMPGQFQYQNSYGQPFNMNKHMYQMYQPNQKHGNNSHQNFQSGDNASHGGHQDYAKGNNLYNQSQGKPNSSNTGHSDLSYKNQSFDSQHQGYQKHGNSSANNSVSAGGNSLGGAPTTGAPNSGSYYNQISHPQQLMGGFPGSFVQQPMNMQGQQGSPAVGEQQQQYQQRGHSAHSNVQHNQYWQQ